MKGGFVLVMSVSLENPMYNKIFQISLFWGCETCTFKTMILGPGVHLANKAIFVKMLYKRGMVVKYTNSLVCRVAFAPKLRSVLLQLLTAGSAQQGGKLSFHARDSLDGPVCILKQCFLMYFSM